MKTDKLYFVGDTILGAELLIMLQQITNAYNRDCYFGTDTNMLYYCDEYRAISKTDINSDMATKIRKTYSCLETGGTVPDIRNSIKIRTNNDIKDYTLLFKCLIDGQIRYCLTYSHG